MKSIWDDEVILTDRQGLIGSFDTDVVVIGGGLTGILTAYLLKEQGREVVVLEKDRIAAGVTGNTTAKITSQHGLIYDKLIQKCGIDKAKAYGQANQEAISAYENLIKEKNISCDFEKCSSYLYSVAGTEELKREQKAAKIAGIEAEFVQETELPFEVKGAVCFREQAKFHPLKFIQGIADDITIYEQTRVITVRKHTVYTELGTIKAKHIVFATHYPFINIPGLFFLRQHQERSYVLALKNAKKLQGMYYGIDKDALSFRSAGDILLMGGGAHRTGDTGGGSAYGYLKSESEKYFPEAEEVARWSAQDCTTHDGIPFIGKYSVLRPYWYVATGFKKWGMTTAMAAAKIITDIICERENAYAKTFSPQRLYFRAAFQDAGKDMGISIKNLAKGYFRADAMQCPHMGCEMQWNADELSWDCPCHGSRLDYDRNVLDGPAQEKE